MKLVDNKYLCFWGYKDIYSNFYKCEFQSSLYGSESLPFSSSEKYFMASKAVIFKDYNALVKIMASDNPKEQKQFGREIIGFDEDVWNQYSKGVMLHAVFCKFHQNQELRDQLKKTLLYDYVLVEASPVDKIWGVGLDQESSLISDPSKWKGKNELGNVLMQVRKMI